MPIELEGLDTMNMLIEYRGIRGGERGERHPTKTLPIVRMPMKNKNRKFDADELVMMSAAARIGETSWTGKVTGIPVFLLSDKILGERGVVYVERALYSQRGRLCASSSSDPNAHQRIDIDAYARNKTIMGLNVARDVKCDEDCPLWGTPKKKTDCKWRAITTVQLQDSLVFPSPTRYRTTSKNTIRAMLTSLRFISDVTQGVLIGIPLILGQRKIEVRDAEGKNRIIPVMFFDFLGTHQQLRAHAIAELRSRETLKQAVAGELPDAYAPSFVENDLGGGEEMVDEIEGSAEDDSQKPARNNLIEVSSDVAMLYKRLGFTKARRNALENKHEGDLDAVLNELKLLSPDFDPAPGEPGDSTEPATESEDNFLTDDLFDK